MSEFEIRAARQEELLQLGAMGAYVYAGSFGDTPDNVISQTTRPEWTTCAFHGDRLVASFAAIPFTMRSNGNAVSMAGISSVGTLPEYRRRGLSRSLMTEGLRRMKEQGQAVASLWASQAGIYQRYQFAAASVQRTYRIDVVDIAFHDGDFGSGDVERTPLSDGFARAKRVYIAHIADRMCYLHRSQALWQMNMLDEQEQDGPVHLALCRDGDEDVGYLLYTLRAGKVSHRARSQEMKIRELVALTPDAYRSLWRFIAAHDLVGSVTHSGVPMDDPAPELMQEPRMLHTEDGEGLWFRIVDVEQALSQRGYLAEGVLRLEVSEDRIAPWNSGTWQLEASAGGATVSKTEAEPDLRLSSKALASLYTGFRSARELAVWGLLEGSDKAISQADGLFRMKHAPHAPDHF